MRTCTFCNREVNPSSRFIYHRITGWERKGQQGGSDITLRQKQDEYACEACISLRRSDRTAGQESLI